MNLLAWFRRTPDPELPVVKKEIEREVSKLNGATERLTTLVDAIVVHTKKTGQEDDRAFTRMLDETVETLRKEKRP